MQAAHRRSVEAHTSWLQICAGLRRVQDWAMGMHRKNAALRRRQVVLKRACQPLDSRRLRLARRETSARSRGCCVGVIESCCVIEMAVMTKQTGGIHANTPRGSLQVYWPESGIVIQRYENNKREREGVFCDM